jgi:hypothetical protein
MFSIPTIFLNVNDVLYKVLRTFKEDQVINVEGLKQLLHIDIVFRKDGLLYFCDVIQDLEIINQ